MSIVGKPLSNIYPTFTRWWQDPVLFFSAQEPMHNSEKQEATANCRNVLSPHSFLSIFRTSKMMVLSIVWIRDYTGSRPRSIWSASDFIPTENHVGLKEWKENKNQFLFSFTGFAWALAEERSGLSKKAGLQSDFHNFKQRTRQDLILKKYENFFSFQLVFVGSLENMDSLL